MPGFRWQAWPHCEDGRKHVRKSALRTEVGSDAARIRDGVGEVVGDGCLALDIGTRALYIGAEQFCLRRLDEPGSLFAFCACVCV